MQILLFWKLTYSRESALWMDMIWPRSLQSSSFLLSGILRTTMAGGGSNISTPSVSIISSAGLWYSGVPFISFRSDSWRMIATFCLKGLTSSCKKIIRINILQHWIRYAIHFCHPSRITCVTGCDSLCPVQYSMNCSMNKPQDDLLVKNIGHISNKQT